MTDEHYPYVNGGDPAQRFEAQLVATARALPYPATPDLAPAVLRATALSRGEQRSQPGAAPHVGVRAPRGTRRRNAWERLSAAISGTRLGWALVAVLKTIGAALKDLGRSVVAHLGEHPDEKIFTSLPRSGQINAAQMLAEWGDCRQAYDGPDSVAALAGATPVTKESGKHRAVHFRWACNKRFRVAVTTFASNVARIKAVAEAAVVGAIDDDAVRLDLDRAQRAVTPGQSGALYRGAVVIVPPEMNDPVSDTVPAPAASVPGCTLEPAVIVTLPPPDVTPPLEVLIDPEVAVSDTAPPLVVIAPLEPKEPAAFAVRLPPAIAARLIEPPVAVAVTAALPALRETLDRLSWLAAARPIAPPLVAIEIGDAATLWIVGAFSVTAPPAVVMPAPSSSRLDTAVLSASGSGSAGAVYVSTVAVNDCPDVASVIGSLIRI